MAVLLAVPALLPKAGTAKLEIVHAIKAARVESAANSFEVIGREWLALKAQDWVDDHTDKQTARLVNHAFPYIGRKAITETGQLRYVPPFSKSTR